MRYMNRVSSSASVIMIIGRYDYRARGCSADVLCTDSHASVDMSHVITCGL